MKTLTCILASTTLIATASTALADDLTDDIQRSPRGVQPQEVTPVSIAPIFGRNADGTLILGEWQPYLGDRTDNGDFPPPIYDAYEGAVKVCQPEGDLFPANGPLSGGVEPACDFGGGETGDCGDGDTARWFFGPDAFFSGYIAPVEQRASGAGSEVTFLATAWNTATGSGSNDPCGQTVGNLIIAVNIYDNSVGSILLGAGGEPIDGPTLEAGFKIGVALNFGPIQPGDGFFFTNADLTGGFELNMEDGDAFEMFFFDEDPVTGDIRVSHSQQAMLWYPKDDSLQGTSNGINYIDGASGDCNDPDAFNGTYESAEFADFNGAVACPDALQAMIGFYGEPEAGAGLCPETATLLRGLPVSGDVNDVCGSDDSYMQARPDVFAPTNIPPVRYEFTGTSPTNAPNAMSVTVEANVAVDNILQRVLVFNFDQQQYELAGQQVATTTDSVVTFDVPGFPPDYVDAATNEVRMQVAYVQVAFNILPTWVTSIDEAVWNIEE